MAQEQAHIIHLDIKPLLFTYITQAKDFQPDPALEMTKDEAGRTPLFPCKSLSRFCCLFLTEGAGSLPPQRSSLACGTSCLRLTLTPRPAVVALRLSPPQLLLFTGMPQLLGVIEGHASGKHAAALEELEDTLSAWEKHAESRKEVMKARRRVFSRSTRD